LAFSKIRSLTQLVFKVPVNEYHQHALYVEMHNRNAFPGCSWTAHVDDFLRVVPAEARQRILDFGCGPKGGLMERFGEAVLPYDPHVEKYSGLPWGRTFESVFSSDVLEHMSLLKIREFFDNIRDSSARYVFLNVSTRKAFKTLPDGSNAHLTIKPASWWIMFASEQLGTTFEPILAREDLLRSEVTMCLRRHH
jgi:hypothetical protein